jgi:hypothetical protein
VELVGYPRVVGKDHLKFRVRHEGVGGYIEAIGFGMGSRIKELKESQWFDLVFNIDENEYRGTVTKQLRIHDFRPSDDDSTLARNGLLKPRQSETSDSKSEPVILNSADDSDGRS